MRLPLCPRRKAIQPQSQAHADAERPGSVPLLACPTPWLEPSRCRNFRQLPVRYVRRVRIAHRIFPSDFHCLFPTRFRVPECFERTTRHSLAMQLDSHRQFGSGLTDGCAFPRTFLYALRGKKCQQLPFRLIWRITEQYRVEVSEAISTAGQEWVTLNCPDGCPTSRPPKHSVETCRAVQSSSAAIAKQLTWLLG